MAFIDLGALVRSEQAALKNSHSDATLATTRMHIEADEREGMGLADDAAHIRQAADECQARANRRFRPNSN